MLVTVNEDVRRNSSDCNKGLISFFTADAEGTSENFACCLKKINIFQSFKLFEKCVFFATTVVVVVTAVVVAAVVVAAVVRVG